jgi:hypothetical protein
MTPPPPGLGRRVTRGGPAGRGGRGSGAVGGGVGRGGLGRGRGNP